MKVNSVITMSGVIEVNLQIYFLMTFSMAFKGANKFQFLSVFYK